MASRGKTVTGTDGNDHKFREKVAVQYKVSAKLKKNLQRMFYILLSPFAIISLHVFKLNDVFKMTNQVLPEPHLWEQLYLLSVIFNLIGFTSLSRNNVQRLSIYFYGSSITVFSAIAWAAYINATDAAMFVMEGRVRAYLFGQPLVIVTYFLLTVLTQMNIFALNYARNLMKAWQAKGCKSE